MIHKPVLLKEAIEFLFSQGGKVFIDATCGLGGHARGICEKSGIKGRVLCIDKDAESLRMAQEKLKNFKNCVFCQGNFKELKEITAKNNFKKVDGVLYDLGVSSYQIETRGLSFKKDMPLDMRIGGGNLTAFKIINDYPQKKLEKIFREYGEEEKARKITRLIVKERSRKPIRTTKELSLLIEGAVKRKKIHPATKVFQALRIAVNQELETLAESLPQAVDLLQKNGVLVVISFHSLEDRIVKIFFKKESKECICPKEFVVCQCSHQPTLKIITKKPIIPTEAELKANPRARSAKLRVAIKI